MSAFTWSFTGPLGFWLVPFGVSEYRLLFFSRLFLSVFGVLVGCDYVVQCYMRGGNWINASWGV